jgi:dihydrofolate synthase/folylpolyglutamate synthase
MTALALWSFNREQVDWVVWETGLGGRLDATNIVVPEVCIITNIGLDHQQYLGQELRDIAMEKAGIIKHHVPVVTAVDSGEAAKVIEAAALSQESSLTLVSQDLAVRDLGLRHGRQMAQIDGQQFILGLVGSHQVYNAACAVAALRTSNFRNEISDAALARGLESTVWSGRFEILSESPLTVLDGAHNPAGVRKLIQTWSSLLSSRGLSKASTHLVFASISEKNIAEMAQLLKPLAAQISLVRLANERGAEPAALSDFFSGIPSRLYDSVGEIWQSLASAPSHMPILLTGSLFLVGEVLAQRQQSTDEYRLNERLEATIPVR